MKYERYSTAIWPYQAEALRDISNQTGISQAYIIREAIDDYLEKTGEVVTKEE